MKLIQQIISGKAWATFLLQNLIYQVFFHSFFRISHFYNNHSEIVENMFSLSLHIHLEILLIFYGEYQVMKSHIILLLNTFPHKRNRFIPAYVWGGSSEVYSKTVLYPSCFLLFVHCLTLSKYFDIWVIYFTRFESLRSVPAYEKALREGFDRCLDLYLCPRTRKKRVSRAPMLFSYQLFLWKTLFVSNLHQLFVSNLHQLFDDSIDKYWSWVTQAQVTK